MSEKENRKQEWTDPKDFGFPFVELVPLTTNTDPHPSASLAASFSTAKSEEKEQKLEIEPKSPGIKDNGQEKSKMTSAKEKTSTLSWVWLVLVFAVALLGVIYWQIRLEQKDVLAPGVTSDQSKTSSPVEDSQDPPEKERTPEANPPFDNQDSTLIVTQSSSQASQSVETGTTIATKEERARVIRIESREDRARYFVVVASVPNESLAIKMVDEFSGKSSEIYLITPYESNQNYRIAVGKFDTWKNASAEAARIKSQFSEDLWILNY